MPVDSKISKKDFLYEGKAKRLFTTSDEDKIWVEFKNDLTAFNAVKKGSFEGKGALNLKISDLVFDYLESKGIANHKVETVSETEQIVEKVEIVPLEVVVRNKAAGSICKRLGFEKGHQFKRPMFEVFYKKDELADPLLTFENIVEMELCELKIYEEIKLKVLELNTHLKELFAKAGVDLVDFKVEFGLSKKGEVLLADEISPDSCRLWDLETGESLDKDRFRQDQGRVEESYKIILEKLEKAVSL